MVGIEQVGTQCTDTCSGIRDRKAVKLVDLFVVGEGVVCVTNGIRCSCGQNRVSNTVEDAERQSLDSVGECCKSRCQRAQATPATLVEPDAVTMNHRKLAWDRTAVWDS